jgi:hypothetical protein
MTPATDLPEKLVRIRNTPEVVSAGAKAIYVRRLGRINRINSRATVLVESDQGTLYGDGKRYLKYYVPLALLRKVGPSD